MKSSSTVPFKDIAKNEELAKKKNQERPSDFRKEEIQLAFVDVDKQLDQLAKNYDNISKVRRLVTIQQIRNRLFELCNFCLYNLNIREFASHDPDSQTPLNSSED